MWGFPPPCTIACSNGEGLRGDIVQDKDYESRWSEGIPPLWGEVILEGRFLNLLLNCLRNPTGIDVAQDSVLMLISQCLIIRKQQKPEVSMWLFQGCLKAHNVALVIAICGPSPARLDLGLGLCLLADLCLQSLTSISSTSCLWTQDSRHNLPYSSWSSHTVTLQTACSILRVK